MLVNQQHDGHGCNTIPGGATLTMEVRGRTTSQRTSTESIMLQHVGQARRARAILGTLALAAMVVLSGPASAAHAAGPPDFRTVLEAKSWSVAPGDPAYFTAFYNRGTADNGPANVTLYLQKG